ncbi:MAG: hypothetical protein ACFFCO_11940 [Promethearchaeota archaeon]
MSGEYPRGMCEIFEDFLGDNSNVLTETVADSATQDAVAKHGGWWRMTMDGGDADACMIATEVAFEPDEGHPVIFETRMYTTDADKTSFYAGFSDANTETEAIVIEDEDGTLSSIATDAFGFLLEGEQDVTWQAVGVDTDVDKTQDTLDNATDAADSVTQTLRIEANPNDSGTAHYIVDGELVETQTSWFDSGIVYCGVVSGDDRGTAHYIYIDYIYVCAPRS